MPTDPKQGKRIVDPDALALARISGDECVACGAPASNVHHVIQKGAPHLGDDVPGNLLLICGTGTMLCHGAMHGTPYLAPVGAHGVIGKDGRDIEGPHYHLERRDQQWVADRIGTHIALHRPDVIEYVLGKLGRSAGIEHLRQYYGIVMT